MRGLGMLVVLVLDLRLIGAAVVCLELGCHYIFP